jgi:outer membrane protein assembly factor BamB
MYVTPDGNVYAATGPNGQLFVITPDGKHEVVLDSHENNLLSLIGDGRDTLYVGTDPHGLVYRVNRKTKDVFVMHDAAESEISALVLASDGTLYAGTGETVEAGAAETPATATRRPTRRRDDWRGDSIIAARHARPAADA